MSNAVESRDDIKPMTIKGGGGEPLWVLLALLVAGLLVLAVLFTGCTYTAPSIATPDLIERVSNGHTICYYRKGPDRGYVKCCPECEHPSHQQTITQGAKP